MAKRNAKSAGDKLPALIYTGPDYLKTIRLAKSTIEVDPRSFDGNDVADFLKKHPTLSHWWTPPVDAVKSEENDINQ